MHSHSFRELSNSSAYRGKQAAHLPVFSCPYGLQDSSQIVAYVFRKVEGRMTAAHAEAPFNELPPDSEDGGGGQKVCA